MRTSDVAQLRQWLGTVTYSSMRRIEELHPVVLPNGTQLRGIQVAPGLFLARDRSFYFNKNGTGMPTSYRRVLMDVTLDSIQATYEAARVAAFERRQAKYAANEDNTQ